MLLPLRPLTPGLSGLVLRLLMDAAGVGRETGLNRILLNRYGNNSNTRVLDAVVSTENMKSCSEILYDD